MILLHHRMRKVCNAAPLAAMATLVLLPVVGFAALERMDDQAMSGVSGAGMALAFEDFRWLVKPTSYFEQVGSIPSGGTVFQRGDLRWYGLNLSGAGLTGFHFDETGSNGFGTACDATSLACPRGGLITDFAPHDNPYVLRAYSPQGIAYDGTLINTDANNPDKTIYEYVAPTSQPDYTMSFWGEIEVGRTGDNANLSVGTGDILKSQTIIRGNAAGSVFRLFQFTESGNETFAIMYHSYLRGDFRFSAAQATGGGASDVVGIPVRFDDNEGLHFKDVEAYVPFGQLYYQAMILDSVPANDGNFTLEVPRLRDPGIAHTNPLNAAMQHFYSFAVTESADAGFITARVALLSNTPGANLAAYEAVVGATNLPASYATTHGYSRWGDFFPCRGIGCPAVPVTAPVSRNEYNDTTSGMFFRKCTGCSDIDAFAYMLTAADVRAGNNQYTCPGGEQCTSDGFTPRGVTGARDDGLGTLYSGSYNPVGRYYAAADSCTASSGTDYHCGYGGTYSIDAGSDHVFVVGKSDPSETYGIPSRPYTERSAGYPCGFLNSDTCYDPVPRGIPVIRTDVVNIGDSRAEGLQVNYMKFTSLGVQ